jgi:hypothetical protein
MNQKLIKILKITEFTETEMFLAVDRFPAGSVDGTRRLMAMSVIFHSASDSR